MSWAPWPRAGAHACWNVFAALARMVRRYWVIVNVAYWWRRVRRPAWRLCIRCRLAAWCTLIEAMAAGLSLWSLYIGAVTVWTATATANLVISNAPTYPVPQLPLDATTLTVAALTGVVLTPLALGFRALSQRAEKIKAKDRSLLWRIPVAFALVAVVSLWLPEILGNGRLLTQHTFNVSLDAAAGGLSAVAAWYVVALCVAKAAVVLLSLRSGSYGGTLTPGLALRCGGRV